jgi:LCP family protein required for cell wall assembly
MKNGNPSKNNSPNPGEKNQTEPTSINPRKKSRKKLWLGIVGSLIFVLVFGGIFLYFRVSSFVTDSFSGRNESSLLPVEDKTATSQPVTAVTTFATSALTTVAAPAPVTPIPTVTPAKPENDLIQRIKNKEKMVALVVGYGGENHDGPYLTDMIMLMVYDPGRQTATLINIPRDLYVFIPWGGKDKGNEGKINTAFSLIMNSSDSRNFAERYHFTPENKNSKIDAGINLLKDVVEQVTGVSVNYWVALNFVGFKQFVDALGGLDVNVDMALDDYNYPAHDDTNLPYAVTHIHFDAGLQHLNGERALQYVRSRQSVQEGTDFARSRHQMKLISVIKEQVSQPTIILKVLGIMNALQGNFRTSLSLPDSKALIDYFKGEGSTAAHDTKFVSAILSTENLLVSSYSAQGSFILLPSAGQNNYSSIRTWIKSQIN